MSYCLYLRKSRADIEAESRGEDETLSRHEKILLELAGKLKLDITHIHREVVSGESISSRPVMQKLLTEVEQGFWKGILVVEVERLARGDTIDQGIVAQAFKYSNTKIITPMKTYDPANEFDEEFFEFGLFMSRREYKTINRRLQQGRMQSVKEGRYVGNVPPYGYKRVKLEKEKGYTLTPHPEQARIIRMIFDLYTCGTGVSLIVRKLNNMKVPTVKGGDWVNATIQGLLRNPVYIGKLRWKFRPHVKRIVNGQMVRERPRAAEEDWILADGLHEAIVDEDIFNKAQDVMDQNPSPPVPATSVIKNPLAGIIVCGKCGRRMVRRPYSSGQQDSLICPVTSCDNVSSCLHLVEERLLQALEHWLEDYKVKLETETQTTEISVEIGVLEDGIKKLDGEIQTLNRQLDSLHDLLEQGIYTTDKFIARSRILSERLEAAASDKKQLEEELINVAKREEGKKSIIPKIEKAIRLYGATEPPAEKNKLLKEIIEKVVYEKKVKSHRSERIDQFSLVILPRLPK